jgi:hypothetical protein
MTDKVVEVFILTIFIDSLQILFSAAAIVLSIGIFLFCDRFCGYKVFCAYGLSDPCRQ